MMFGGSELTTYWGDLHSHCSASYGQGTADQALARARQQLDFCSVTGHAFWPDMPTDRERYGEIIDYHRVGFETLARNWDALLKKQEAATRPNEFVALPSYEWHSLKYGDHNVYSIDPDLALTDAPDLPALRNMAAATGAIIVPHHIGYQAGYRGIDWRHFDAAASPLVEVYSLHGASVSSEAPFPMLHDMGPRDAGSTAVAGWQLGHRFGIIGSTDHHGGFPGSFGDGRAAVIATSLTRQGIWEAILARRTYAVTGDKIQAEMRLAEASIGEIVEQQTKRQVSIHVVGIDALDRVELLKNERVVRRWHAGDGVKPLEDSGLCRVRITWGWGRKDVAAHWDLSVRVNDCDIRSVEPCFSGQTVVAPKGVGGHGVEEDEIDLPHEILASDSRHLAIRSVTMGNRSTRHGTTQSVSLLLDADHFGSANISIETSHGKWRHTLEELRAGPRTHYQCGWLSPALHVGPAVPEHLCCAAGAWIDDGIVGADAKRLPAQNADIYRLRVAQVNGQWAWLTPIWMEW